MHMTVSELYREAKAGNREQICKFMRDMKKAGLKMRYYEGRYFWKGPAVSCDNVQEVLSNTKVPCLFDSLGRGVIVYPQQTL